MQFPNQIFFVTASLILWGLVAASKPLVSKGKFFQAENYWFVALISTASSFSLFILAPHVNLVLLTLANVCVIAGNLYLAIFCHFLRNPKARKLGLLPLFVLLIFGLVFEYLRQTEAFTERVFITLLIVSICLIWQLVELLRLCSV